jgi:hypothetical protein
LASVAVRRFLAVSASTCPSRGEISRRDVPKLGQQLLAQTWPIARIEQNKGIVKGNFSTILKIQKTLEQAGIHFMEDDSGQIGVRWENKDLK